MTKILKSLVILGLFIGILHASVWFSNQDYFKINEIEITGNYNIIENDIIVQINNFKNENLIYIDTLKLKNIILKDIRVQDANIKKVYPSKLIIEIKERQPYVYVKKGNDFLIADKDLNIFGYYKETVNKNLPVIIYKDEETKKDFQTIISNIKNDSFYNEISEIRANNKTYEIILNNGVKIITDTLVSSEKYDQVYSVYKNIQAKNKLENNNKLEYLDARFKDIIAK